MYSRTSTRQLSAKLIRAVAVGTLLFAPTLAQAIVINGGDISAGHYVYDLTFTELADNTVISAAAETITNMTVLSEGTGTGERRFLRGTVGQTSASFTLRFDFTNSGFRPSSFVLTDSMLVNNNSVSTIAVIGLTEYSIDGVNWTALRTKTSNSVTTGSQTSNGTSATQNLATLPDYVLYRVTFTETGGTFTTNNAQWNRTGPTGFGFSPFLADFTVVAVPEPSSALLLAIGVCAVWPACSRRRRLR
jgi:hypothetical protein